MSAQVMKLGGPGEGCSSLKVRRWLVGELPAPDAEKMSEHVRGCARCQAVEQEVAEENKALAAVLPFDTFAAGVAEKLAVPAQTDKARVVSLSSRRRWQTWAVPVFIAASLLIVFSSAFITRTLADRIRVIEGIPVEPTDDGRFRLKGGEPALEVFALRAGRSFKMSDAERVQTGDRLLVVLPFVQKANVLVAFREGTEVNVLYKGQARPGPLSESFEWTGEAAHAQVFALYSDAAIDEAGTLARLRAGDLSLSNQQDLAVTREVNRR